MQDEALSGLNDTNREALKSILTVIKNNLTAQQSANEGLVKGQTDDRVANRETLLTQAGGNDG